ncbi:MAG: TIGR01777 family protein [Bryobacterales bacterium]|nr:TIGR01777 family protein [Bryobacterales bacterium]
MKVTITGASGFVGTGLKAALEGSGHTVCALGRASAMRWDPMSGEPPAESLAGVDAVVHLAGEPVAQRWNTEVKHKIRESRVRGTRHLIQALSTASPRPPILVCASAIGIYGSRGDEILTETAAPGKGFLPGVCAAWEKEADLAEALGIRVVKLRIGIVLGSKGGALAKMLPPFRACVGGQLGSGRQWMSWIHIDDLTGLIRHALENPVTGAMNGTAPVPVTNAHFTANLASALHRPAIFPVPGFAVRALFGEMAEILLGSQRVLPAVALDSGYKFRYDLVEAALKNLV